MALLFSWQITLLVLVPGWDDVADFEAPLCEVLGEPLSLENDTPVRWAFSDNKLCVSKRSTLKGDSGGVSEGGEPVMGKIGTVLAPKKLKK